LVLTLLANTAMGAKHPAETVAESQAVLAETLGSTGGQIPAKLLSDAHGVAIIPRVLKIGLVGAVRMGHGVVIVKDQAGNWVAPQFVTLTGGSVGWQIGAQSSDIILVFNTRKSVDGLLQGKFTIGADAAAAAGPVGRNVAAATDGRLQAEIYTYSRSRGLFAGVSIDGSVIEVDHAGAAIYYAARPGEPPIVPEGAVKLVESVAALSGKGAQFAASPVPATPTPAISKQANSSQPDVLRSELIRSAAALQAVLTPEWQRYLALPAGVSAGTAHPSAETLAGALANFERVAASRQYAELHGRPEFQRTLELLRSYQAALTARSGPINLPPPPSQGK
jgi:lipid-binding SYLF domain-containing protein